MSRNLTFFAKDNLEQKQFWLVTETLNEACYVRDCRVLFKGHC